MNYSNLENLVSKQARLLPAWLLSVIDNICMTAWSVCITVTGSTVVHAAVVGEQYSNVKVELACGSINRCLEVSSILVIFGGEELQWSSVLLLSVPEHGVAAHVDSWTHSALQCHSAPWER